jgi:beta-galactosidase GanA
MNAGGLYGERNGWHLQGYDDHQWAAVTLPYNTKQMGVSWFRYITENQSLLAHVFF